jgi:RNA polymerase sigma-70 factor (ECF subfamily)
MSALPSPHDFDGAQLLCAAPPRRPNATAGREAEERELSTLMRAAQRGDRAAYVQLVRKIMPLLQRVLKIRRGFLQPADRDDLMQDVLLSLHRAIGTFDSQREFVPWLMAIVRNKMVDRARRFVRSTANEILVDDWSEIAVAQPSTSYVEHYGDPEALTKAISRLSPLQQKAIELFKLQELTAKEAATVMGTTPGALRVTVHRAIKSLRTSLGDVDRVAVPDDRANSLPVGHSRRL